MKIKLIKLLREASYGMLVNHEREEIADHLLAEGVIVPPVWVGSTVYYIYDILGEWRMQEMRVILCTYDEQGLYSLRAKSLNGNQDLHFTRSHPYYHLDALRFTKEEAKKALISFRNLTAGGDSP